jgi:hypothetical protein
MRIQHLHLLREGLRLVHSAARCSVESWGDKGIMPFNPDLDASQPALNASQRRQVEQLVRRAGKTCEVCDSDDLSCDERAVRTISDGISVRLFCNNRKDHADGVVGTEQPLFALEENDAHRIGII